MTEVKKEVTSREELFLKALDPEQKKVMYNLYVAVSNAKVNSFVGKDIGNTLNGSEKALFTLGVVSGENNVLRLLKTIINKGW
tara:strand:- start:775 stop:1023 length:249 start_codon:yes stop_codon:yes gene_type:complete